MESDEKNSEVKVNEKKSEKLSMKKSEKLSMKKSDKVSEKKSEMKIVKKIGGKKIIKKLVEDFNEGSEEEYFKYEEL